MEDGIFPYESWDVINAFDDLSCLTADFNSEGVKFEVQILRVSEIFTLGSV